MAAGIEARVPFLDENDCAQACYKYSFKSKSKQKQKKIILRNSLRDSLPSKILDGPKTGFGVIV